MPREPDVLATMVTTTTYGTWLPGDLRGYVDDGVILPGDPAVLDRARKLMAGRPVYLTAAERAVGDLALAAACAEFGYRLTDLSLESWHAHWIVEHGFDAVSVMAGRLKTRMRQRIASGLGAGIRGRGCERGRGQGRIWTEGFCHRCLYTRDEVAIASAYIGRHAGARLVAGVRIDGHAG